MRQIRREILISLLRIVLLQIAISSGEALVIIATPAGIADAAGEKQHAVAGRALVIRPTPARNCG